MTTETKNRDYSASAVDLNNDALVEDAYQNYRKASELSDELRAKLELTPEFKAWTESCFVVAEAKSNLSIAIDQNGSYQDVEAGHYAIKQRKVSKQFHVEPFIKNFEKFVPLVVEQTINIDALKGQIKGKLITEDELLEKGVITTTETYAYIIK